MNRLTVVSLSLLLSGGVVMTTSQALAENGARSNHKDPSIPECSWSKLNAQQYKFCQAEKKKLQAMSPAERDKYLHPNGGGSYQPPPPSEQPAEVPTGGKPAGSKAPESTAPGSTAPGSTAPGTTTAGGEAHHGR